MKISNVVTALVLVSGARAARAAGSALPQAPAVCATTAMSQLAAAAPGGAAALQALAASIPSPKPAPRSEDEAASATEAPPSDLFIENMAVSAFKARRYASARLLLRLAREGTRAEKAAFVLAGSKPYSFPERFYWKTGVVKADAPVCHFVTETFCTVSCWGTGDNERQCREDCRNVIVRSCD